VVHPVLPQQRHQLQRQSRLVPTQLRQYAPHARYQFFRSSKPFYLLRLMQIETEKFTFTKSNSKRDVTLSFGGKNSLAGSITIPAGTFQPGLTRSLFKNETISEMILSNKDVFSRYPRVRKHREGSKETIVTKSQRSRVWLWISKSANLVDPVTSKTRF